MLDLRERGRDVTKFVADLERWIIGALGDFNVKGEIREGRVGVWVERKGPGWAREDKIAAIGVRLRKWVSFHGIAFNVEPDLEHFSGITPCGISAPQFGVTSLVDLGLASNDERCGCGVAHIVRPRVRPNRTGVASGIGRVR